MKLKTSISKIEKNKIILKGYSIEDLMQGRSFPEVIFLTWFNRFPDDRELKMFNAILVSSIDHGYSPPSVNVTRILGSVRAPIGTAVGGGLSAITDVHGGAVERAAEVFKEWGDKEGTVEDKAVKLVQTYKREGKRISGFGHRLHSEDPRSKKLIELAQENGFASKYLPFALAIEEYFKSRNKQLPLNVDGAIAAVIVEMGLPASFGKAFFMLSRMVGLVAHYVEEVENERPMRKFITASTLYEGPWERK